MKILISGYYGFGNMGDEAILKSIIASLRSVKPTIEIIVLSGNVEHTRNTYNVEAINRWNIAKIYATLLKSDGLISGGGSLLQDVTSSRPIVYYTSIMGLAKLARKPVFIYAQGIGPINNTKNQKIASKYLNKCDYITFRDKESIELAKNIGVTKNIHLVADPVMGLSIDDYKSKLYDYNINKKYITVSVRDWNKATVDYLQKIAKACDKIIDSKIDVIFIPMHGEEDYNTSKKVMDMMSKKAKIFPYNTSIEEKILCIKHSKLMIGMRLHALIFAATVKTPMIGISYDPKIDSFLSGIDQKCIGNVYEEWDIEGLVQASLDIINNPSESIKKLESESEYMKNSSIATAKLSIDLFENRGVFKDV